MCKKIGGFYPEIDIIFNIQLTFGNLTVILNDY